MTKDIEREALEGEIEIFIAEAMKAYVVERWADSYQNTSPFAHVINDRNEVWWMKTQAHQLWQFWQAAKAQAVPEGFVLVPMVPSERMINAVRKCYEGEAYLPYSLYSEFVNQAIIERMEAQEPAND